MKHVTPFLLAIIALGATSLWLGRIRSSPSGVAPQQHEPQTETARTAAAIPATVGLAPVETSPTTPGRDLLELPDGSFVAALNGARDVAPLRHYWSAQRPWSPIVALERSSAGIDWYRHEDGSYSTTQMVWRSDLGREDAMTRVAHPGPAAASTAPMREDR